MSETAKYRDLLGNAWSFRMDQRHTECRELVQELRVALPVQPKAVTLEFLEGLPEEEFLFYCDFLCLFASLQRADGFFSESEILLKLLNSVAHLRGNAPFHLKFQSGLNALYRGDYSQGLELFLMARSTAPGIEEKIYCLSNMLSCLESLGQSFDTVLDELRKHLDKIEPAKMLGVREQFDMLQTRQAFRRGDFEQIFSGTQGTRVNQAYHFKFWCSELPYHRFFLALTREEKEKYFTDNPHFLHKAYRTRTLQGVIHPDDLDKFNPSELSDRIYLWTWRWLLDPENHSIEKVLVILENGNLSELLQALSLEDCHLVRNALLWMALLNPSQSTSLERLAKSVRPTQTYPHPLLEFEEGVVTYLLKLRKKEDDAAKLFSKLKKNLLWENASLFLCDLVESEPTQRRTRALDGLIERVQKATQEKKDFKKGQLYVDYSQSMLIWDGGRKREISEPLCFAVDLLKRKECVTFEEFLAVCFGLPRFDSFVHNAKVYNLLSRLKNALPKDVEVKTKNNRIYVDGSWENVVFCEKEQAFEKVTRRQEWKFCLEKSRPAVPRKSTSPSPSVVLAEKGDNALMTRAELEKMIGKSRATASRILFEWLQEGYIKRVGKAKNTKYLVLTPLESKI